MKIDGFKIVNICLAGAFFSALFCVYSFASESVDSEKLKEVSHMLEGDGLGKPEKQKVRRVIETAMQDNMISRSEYVDIESIYKQESEKLLRQEAINQLRKAMDKQSK